MRGREKWKGLTEREREGWREEEGIKTAFYKYSDFKQGAPCRRSGLLGEEDKIDHDKIIRREMTSDQEILWLVFSSLFYIQR